MIDYGTEHATPPSWCDEHALATSECGDWHTGPPVDEFATGQSLVAEQLVARHPGHYMFVPGLGWHTYDGTRWQQGSGLAALQVEQAAVDTARGMIRDAADLDSEERDAWLKVAHRVLGNNAQLQGVVAFVARHRAVLAGVHQLDCDPYTLNVANGTLNLLTRELKAHDPGDRLTKVAGARFDPDATGPRWQQFLDDALGDPRLAESLQRLFGGPGLMGKVIEHTMPVIYGPGGSGKGTFIGAIAGAFGDYAIAAEPDLVMKRNGAHPTGEMDLLGLRLAFVSESDEHRQLAAATMKRLTGGDRVRARRMRQDFIEFDPSHLLVLITNHLPVMPSGDDPAVWRRVRVVPFDRPPATVNKRLGDQLAEERDAILTWLVDGFTAYWDAGNEIGWPESVLAATAAYRSSSDLLGQFLDDTTIKVADAATIGMGDVYSRWKGWLAANAPDARPGRTQDLVRHLRERDETVRPGPSRTKGSVLTGRMFTEDDDQ
jgi:putative DNA primase/helicase